MEQRYSAFAGTPTERFENAVRADFKTDHLIAEQNVNSIAFFITFRPDGSFQYTNLAEIGDKKENLFTETLRYSEYNEIAHAKLLVDLYPKTHWLRLENNGGDTPPEDAPEWVATTLTAYYDRKMGTFEYSLQDHLTEEEVPKKKEDLREEGLRVRKKAISAAQMGGFFSSLRIMGMPNADIDYLNGTEAELDPYFDQIYEALGTELSESAGTWDATLIHFVVVNGAKGIALRQVDPVLYRKDGVYTNAVFSRTTLEKPTVELVRAASRGMDFDVAVVWVKIDRETEKFNSGILWNATAVPYIMTPLTWVNIANTFFPFEEEFQKQNTEAPEEQA